jgi:hypothetical protein
MRPVAWIKNMAYFAAKIFQCTQMLLKQKNT